MNNKMVNVILKFGAYEAHGILKYRPERLYVLMGELFAKGFTVEVYPWIHVNRLGIFIAGRLIFTCRLTYLSLFECNQTCSLAIRKVLEAVEALCQCKETGEERLKYHEGTSYNFTSTQKSTPDRNEQISMLDECDISTDRETDVTPTSDILTNSEKQITLDIMTAEDEPSKVILFDE